MTPKLRSVEYVERYILHVRFEDGIEGNIDLEGELWGEVFEPLRNLEAFRDFRLDRELNTVTWPSGADLAPEFLHEKVAKHSSCGTASGRRRPGSRPAQK